MKTKKFKKVKLLLEEALNKLKQETGVKTKEDFINVNEEKINKIFLGK